MDPLQQRRTNLAATALVLLAAASASCIPVRPTRPPDPIASIAEVGRGQGCAAATAHVKPWMERQLSAWDWLVVTRQYERIDRLLGTVWVMPLTVVVDATAEALHPPNEPVPTALTRELGGEWSTTATSKLPSVDVIAERLQRRARRELMMCHVERGPEEEATRYAMALLGDASIDPERSGSEAPELLLDDTARDPRVHAALVRASARLAEGDPRWGRLARILAAARPDDRRGPAVDPP